MRPVTAPYVNLNGSSRESLMIDRQRAVEAISEAMDYFQKCRPDPWDYQTAPPGAYKAARDAYEKQFAVLDKLCNEIMEVIEFLADEGK